MFAPALPVITTPEQAVVALDARHAALLRAEGILIAQAEDALSCAERAATPAGRAHFVGVAREIMDDAATVRTEIDKIEACWAKRP